MAAAGSAARPAEAGAADLFIPCTIAPGLWREPRSRLFRVTGGHLRQDTPGGRHMMITRSVMGRFAAVVTLVSAPLSGMAATGTAMAAPAAAAAHAAASRLPATVTNCATCAR